MRKYSNQKENHLILIEKTKLTEIKWLVILLVFTEVLLPTCVKASASEFVEEAQKLRKLASNEQKFLDNIKGDLMCGVSDMLSKLCNKAKEKLGIRDYITILNKNTKPLEVTILTSTQQKILGEVEAESSKVFRLPEEFSNLDEYTIRGSLGIIGRSDTCTIERNHSARILFDCLWYGTRAKILP